MEIRSRLDEVYFFTGEDPFISHDPGIRVKLAQLALSYEAALLSGNRALAYQLKKEAYQVRVNHRLGHN